MRKKIAIALAAGVAFGTMFAAPVAASVAEAASSESVMSQATIDAYMEQGNKLFEEGKFMEAAEIYEKAAEGAQTNDKAWLNAGFLYLRAEKYDKAAICCKKSTKINPNNGWAHFYCGMAYFNQAFVPHHLSMRTIFERAAEHGERAAELLPDDVGVQMGAGLIQQHLAGQVGSGREKHLNKAYQYYCRAIDLDPNNNHNKATLSAFVQAWSDYGFQPYTPATQKTDVTGPRSNTPIDPAPGVDRQPGTQAQPGGNVNVTGATNAPSGEFYKALAGNIEYEELKSGVVKLNTNVSCAANAPRGGSLQNIVGDIEYEVLDSGAVQFNLRCGNWFIDEQPNHYKLTNYIFTKPEKFRAYPGAYMVGRLTDEGVIVIEHTLFHGSSFDYNPTTQTFTFYEWYYSDNPNPAERAAIMALPLGVELMRLIDKNTVYVESGAPYRLIDGELYPNKSYYTNTYRYMPYDKTSLTITKVDSPTFKYDYPDQGNSIGHGAGEFDENQCVWFGNLITKNAFHTFPSLFFHYGTTYHGEILLNWNVDAMRAFLAVNGNIGAAPYDVVFMEEDAQYLQ